MWFWNHFKNQIRGRFPDVSMLGEALVFNIDELTDYQKHWGFDSLFSRPWKGYLFMAQL